VDEATGWDEVEVIVGNKEGQEAKDFLAAAGLSPRDLARMVASVMVIAHKPA
jgi:hypothetical protein